MISSPGSVRIRSPRGRRYHAQRRRIAIQQLENRVVRPISEEQYRYDPLLRAPASTKGPFSAVLLLLLGAAALHALVLAIFFGLSRALSDPFPPRPKSDRIEVEMVESPPPAAIEEPEPVPAQTPEAKEPPPPPPPDPVDLEPEAPSPPQPEASPPPRRRVVGLSLESTVVGGTGPGFAVGNTRMGKTEKKADDPATVEKLEPPKNRAAARIPGSVSFTKPKRLRPLQPDYPERQRAQGIEGDVLVLVTLSDTGKVTRVQALKFSDPDFKRAAIQAAWKERFAPATKGGAPIAYTLKYTYRFRLSD